MKYVSITFDDGRSDNFNIAFPIMQKYGLTATLFCTTGYIDGSWDGSTDWKSAKEPMTFENLQTLRENGWEIALHGDKHITDSEDLATAAEKLKTRGLLSENTGFSIPTSNAKESSIRAIADMDYVNYIRCGRRRNTKKLSSRILFGLYTVFHSQFAYNMFNKMNLNQVPPADNMNLYSVVIRCGDDPHMITKFIENSPDNTWSILMFHSILPENNPLYKADAWCYSEQDFETFCKTLADTESKGTISVLNVNKMIMR